MSIIYSILDESSETMVVDENGSAIDWNPDVGEERYCLCNQVSYGDMVACDNNTDVSIGNTHTKQEKINHIIIILFPFHDRIPLLLLTHG